MVFCTFLATVQCFADISRRFIVLEPWAKHQTQNTKHKKAGQKGRLLSCQIMSLLAQPQSGDDIAVALDVLFFQIVQELTAFANEFEQPGPRVEILFVKLEMLGQVDDPVGEQGHLDFR